MSLYTRILKLDRSQPSKQAIPSNQLKFVLAEILDSRRDFTVATAAEIFDLNEGEQDDLSAVITEIQSGRMTLEEVERVVAMAQWSGNDVAFKTEADLKTRLGVR